MLFFFFNDTATTEIYTLSLHDALPISDIIRIDYKFAFPAENSNRNLTPERLAIYHDLFRTLELEGGVHRDNAKRIRDRKSTRLNSSHANISYAVFCLKKKKNILMPYIL